MRLRLLSLAAALAVVAAGGCARQKIMLFNGKDLSGWKLYVPDGKIDPHAVWSVKNGVIRCEGKPNGYIRTVRPYSNYRLHVEWRWPEKPTNSGVLLHMTGPDKIWPKSIECQLFAGNAGDFWLIGGTSITVDGRTVSSADGPTRVKKKKPSSEKPPGQWNSYDIYCRGDTIRCLVNGVLQNYGTDASESIGRICLQSEGSPIEFRNIFIEPLD